jgi:hypothetical protein
VLGLGQLVPQPGELLVGERLHLGIVGQHRQLGGLGPPSRAPPRLPWLTGSSSA